MSRDIKFMTGETRRSHELRRLFVGAVGARWLFVFLGNIPPYIW